MPNQWAVRLGRQVVSGCSPRGGRGRGRPPRETADGSSARNGDDGQNSLASTSWLRRPSNLPHLLRRWGLCAREPSRDVQACHTVPPDEDRRDGRALRNSARTTHPLRQEHALRRRYFSMRSSAALDLGSGGAESAQSRPDLRLYRRMPVVHGHAGVSLLDRLGQRRRPEWKRAVAPTRHPRETETGIFTNSVRSILTP